MRIKYKIYLYNYNFSCILLDYKIQGFGFLTWFPEIFALFLFLLSLLQQIEGNYY